VNGASLAAFSRYVHAAFHAIIKGAEPIQSNSHVSLRMDAGTRFHGEWYDSLQSTPRFRNIPVGVGGTP